MLNMCVLSFFTGKWRGFSRKRARSESPIPKEEKKPLLEDQLEEKEDEEENQLEEKENQIREMIQELIYQMKDSLEIDGLLYTLLTELKKVEEMDDLDKRKNDVNDSILSAKETISKICALSERMNQRKKDFTNKYSDVALQ